jgi:hypothetical protein
MPRKLRGTLTLNIFKSVHTSKYPILLSEPYPEATPEDSELLSPENYVRIVVYAPDLRTVSFYGAREFFHYSTIIKLILLCMIIIVLW